MNQGTFALVSIAAAALIAGGILSFLASRPAHAADEDPPLNLARDGFFSVGGKTTTINGKSYVVGQMYVEMRIPQKQTHPYPIVMVHGRHPLRHDLLRARRMAARAGRSISRGAATRSMWSTSPAAAAPATSPRSMARRGSRTPIARRRATCSRPNTSSGRRRICIRSGLAMAEPDDAVTLQMVGSFLPEIAFEKQQEVSRDAMVALLDKVGPAIVLVHSQAGPIGWSTADARPDLVKAVVAVEPNGPPVRGARVRRRARLVQGGRLALPYGIAGVPLAYDPAVKDASELKWVKEDKPDAPGLVTCWKQAEPPASSSI
jgi:hypothetical protein